MAQTPHVAGRSHPTLTASCRSAAGARRARAGTRGPSGDDAQSLPAFGLCTDAFPMTPSPTPLFKFKPRSHTLLPFSRSIFPFFPCHYHLLTSEYFSLFRGRPAAYGVPSQGSDPSHRLALHHSCGNAGSFTHCASTGIEPASWHSKDTADPVHSGNSLSTLFFISPPLARQLRESHNLFSAVSQVPRKSPGT